jgi:DNA polymerase-3 subunit delta
MVRKFSVPEDSTEWIMARVRNHYRAQIDPQAAAALASVTPGDLRRADNELFKLIAYVGHTRAISEADVALLTPYVAEANMFAMVDALAEGRAQTALSLLYRLLEQGEDVFSLFGMITRQFRLLLLAKAHLSNGGGRGDLPAVLGTKSKFVADKVAVQSRGFELPTLERIYRTLHQYDVQMKTGVIEPRLALDLLVAGLSR